MVKNHEEKNHQIVSNSMRNKRLVWNDLRVFYCTARFESFSKAADYLKVSQSSLSRIVGRLERTFAEKLFVRHPRGLTFTPAGEIAYSSVGEIYHIIDNLHSKINQNYGKFEGEISLWTDSYFLQTYLIKHLDDFMKLYPKIYLRISCQNVPDPRQSQADVIIHPHFLKKCSLVHNPLVITKSKLYASQSYLDTYGTPKKIEDLNHHQLISCGDLPKHSTFKDINWHLYEKIEIGKLPRKPFLELSCLEDCLRFASNGFGITASFYNYENLKNYNLVEVLSKIECSPMTYHYIYFKSVNAELIRLIKILQKYLFQKIGNIVN